MTPIATIELVLVVALALVVASIVFVWLRRRWISGGQPLMICAINTGDRRWRLGLARIAGDRLDWFSVVGPSFRPDHSWLRHDLDFGAPRRLDEAVPGLPGDAVCVSGRSRSGDYELAMSPAAYTSLRAWLESSPPGFNVNVA
ncbi:DUF2550 domain-containing protein [Knoellia subterranea]|uniref:DUF2550 domain-containing protein n=1 Tax=Knoellia subterranea KCTC 19937 TaxID=1385521 RepID=A0A0A0JTA8_9MICO|nr:DUF2550 domain-containing protein [Knoellia subterranea]KGN39312.1 hypothetical protein N803_02260 [Knoellia subterranea KCTC 19937]